MTSRLYVITVCTVSYKRVIFSIKTAFVTKRMWRRLHRRFRLRSSASRTTSLSFCWCQSWRLSATSLNVASYNPSAFYFSQLSHGATGNKAFHLVLVEKQNRYETMKNRWWIIVEIVSSREAMHKNLRVMMVCYCDYTKWCTFKISVLIFAYCIF